MNEEEKAKVAAFMKTAWAIDGEVTFLEPEAVRALIHTHRLHVMRLTDSKRGTFYVGTFKEKNHE